MALIPGVLAFASIPMATPIEVAQFEWLGRAWGPYTFLFQGYEFGIGIVFVLGVSSLGAYALLMAGWGSSNKYSLLGALRASAQMISYELALSLSLVGILMIFGTFSFREIIAQQQGSPLNWGIFYQPLGALIFFAATFAESNRLPFDLPEAEGELVAGFHTEYGGFKMLMFYIGEYGHMMVASGLFATFYLGGYAIPGLTVDQVAAFWSAKVAGPTAASALTAVSFFLMFLVKLVLLLWIFIWVRWTLPRFRYDQLMNLGWKTMLPWALFNTVLTAIWLVVKHS